MFTRVELTDWNTPRLFLMFYIHLHLLSIAFWKLWFNLTMESFKSSCIWKHPLFCWWFSSKIEVNNNDYNVQIFLFYLLIFSHWFLKSNQISSGIIFFFYTFYESYFFPGQTPVPPRSWMWILDLSHDPFWAIWLAEVTKSHQHHDRIGQLSHWPFVTSAKSCLMPRLRSIDFKHPGFVSNARMFEINESLFSTWMDLTCLYLHICELMISANAFYVPSYKFSPTSITKLWWKQWWLVAIFTCGSTSFYTRL